MSDARNVVCTIVANQVANLTVQRVAEIPDRNSPDDQPDMMLVTGDELKRAVIASFEEWWDGCDRTADGED